MEKKVDMALVRYRNNGFKYMVPAENVKGLKPGDILSTEAAELDPSDNSEVELLHVFESEKNRKSQGKKTEPTFLSMKLSTSCKDETGKKRLLVWNVSYSVGSPG